LSFRFNVSTLLIFNFELRSSFFLVTCYASRKFDF